MAIKSLREEGHGEGFPRKRRVQTFTPLVIWRLLRNDDDSLSQAVSELTETFVDVLHRVVFSGINLRNKQKLTSHSNLKMKDRKGLFEKESALLTHRGGVAECFYTGFIAYVAGGHER